MKIFHMYMCDSCGHSRERPGVCTYCQVPLTEYTKDSQEEYQVDLSDAMRVMDEQRWYV